MTHPLLLPALDGRDPLGFLAALGVLCLLTDHQPIHPVALSFDPPTATAVLHSQHTDITQVTAALGEIIDHMPAGAVIPGLPAGFPAPMRQKGGEPNRVPRLDYRTLITTHGGDGKLDPLLRWIAVLLTDLAVDDQKRAVLTPYIAPVAKQSLRGFFDNPLTATRAQPDRLHEALTNWRRIADVTGENLDHRALRPGVDQPDGKSLPAGVPGATWLATMALPLLRLTGDGTTRSATLWHRAPDNTTELMIWPIWRHPLDVHAVQAILEHPALQPKFRNGTTCIRLTPLRPLGVFHAAAAHRQRQPALRYNEVLTPMPLSVIE
ncbi:hypothetical protein AB0B31_27935 [Catellatospora citrea]|uniref:type I-G CRISPR-associated protein, Cas3-extension family n=1 Tax=Catellatospora citrea TaxID=53366 RepID=UPI0033F620C4